MGAGHGYAYKKFMLIDEDELKDNDNFLHSLDGLPFEEQVSKILEENYQGMESEEDIIETYGDCFLTVFKEEEEEKSFETLNVEEMLDINNQYDDWVDDFKETIHNIATTCNSEYFPDKNKTFLHDEQLRTLGTLTMKGNFTTAEIGIALIADGYNDGLVTYVKDAQGETYAKDIDFDTIAIAGTGYDMQYYLENIHAHVKTIDNMIDFVDNCDCYLDDEQINALFESDRNIYDDIITEMDFDTEGVEGLKERYKNDADLEKKLNKYLRIVPHQINDALKKEAKDFETKFNNFTDELMNRAILSCPNGTFRYPTSGYTSSPYEKEGRLFGDNTGLQIQLKGEFGLIDTFKNIDDIKQAVMDGKKVKWANSLYDVQYWDKPKGLHVICSSNQNAVGLQDIEFDISRCYIEKETTITEVAECYNESEHGTLSELVKPDNTLSLK